MHDCAESRCLSPGQHRHTCSVCETEFFSQQPNTKRCAYHRANRPRGPRTVKTGGAVTNVCVICSDLFTLARHRNGQKRCPKCLKEGWCVTPGCTNKGRYRKNRQGNWAHNALCHPCSNKGRTHWESRQPSDRIAQLAELVLPRPVKGKWRDDAACKGMDTNVFFPEQHDPAAQSKAREICLGCPVRAECLSDGLFDKHAIVGGTSDRERRAIRKRLGVRLCYNGLHELNLVSGENVRIDSEGGKRCQKCFIAARRSSDAAKTERQREARGASAYAQRGFPSVA